MPRSSAAGALPQFDPSSPKIDPYRVSVVGSICQTSPVRLFGLPLLILSHTANDLLKFLNIVAKLVKEFLEKPIEGQIPYLFVNAS